MNIDNFTEIVNRVFNQLLVVFIFLVFIDELADKPFSSYIDLNHDYFLIAVIIAGVLSILLKPLTGRRSR